MIVFDEHGRVVGRTELETIAGYTLVSYRDNLNRLLDNSNGFICIDQYSAWFDNLPVL